MRAARLSLPLALAVTLLSGCMVGPDYRRPSIELPGRFAAAAGEPAAAGVSQTWWGEFNDPLLVELVQAALTNNTDLQQAVAAVERADAVLREAGAALLPEVTGSGTAARARVSENIGRIGAPAVRNSFRAAVTTSFELDFWGRLRRAREAALAQAVGSRYARDTVALSLTGAVAQVYVALRALDAQVAVSEQTLENRQRTRRLIRSRYQGGIASPLDLQQAEVAYATAAAQLIDLQRQRRLVESQLGALIGQVDIRIAAEQLQELPLPPMPPPGLPSALLDARPDVREAEARLIAANANIGIAKAALFPSISLTGQFGSESSELADLFAGGSAIWSLGGRLDVPIFDAGRRRARVDQATATQQEALARYVGVVRNAFRDVNDALISVQQTAEIEQALAARMSAAEKALRLAEIRYESGYSPFLEVLDAQRTANDAELAYIRNRQDRLT
ncbi:MAG TPA: efflux transporter outer membrane subunit, partial [Gammaproteobacteria bacterium]|nr:efflux transporter outer membrane subunit [Gammaproteobacteria bacterium]